MISRETKYTKNRNVFCVSPLAAHVHIHFHVTLGERILIKFGIAGF
jgi:hypothetical protein